MPWDYERGRWIESEIAAAIAEIRETRCRKCTARIKFVPVQFSRSKRSDAHPIDAEPAVSGNIYQTDSGLCLIARGAELKRVLAERYRVEFYSSHFDTCPGAGSFRKERRTIYGHEGSK